MHNNDEIESAFRLQSPIYAICINKDHCCIEGYINETQ